MKQKHFTAGAEYPPQGAKLEDDMKYVKEIEIEFDYTALNAFPKQTIFWNFPVAGNIDIKEGEIGYLGKIIINDNDEMLLKTDKNLTNNHNKRTAAISNIIYTCTK